MVVSQSEVIGLDRIDCKRCNAHKSACVNNCNLIKKVHKNRYKLTVILIINIMYFILKYVPIMEIYTV